MNTPLEWKHLSIEEHMSSSNKDLEHFVKAIYNKQETEAGTIVIDCVALMKQLAATRSPVCLYSLC